MQYNQDFDADRGAADRPGPQASEEVGEPSHGTDAPMPQITSTHYAGFWRRVVASIFDGAVTILICLIIAVLLTFAAPEFIESVGGVVSLIVFWLYYALMESSRHQATIGKRIIGIKVTDENGSRISFARASGRTFAKILSAIPFGIGYLMVAFTKRKQGLHDMMAGTLVIKHAPSHIWKAILFAMIVVVVTVAAVGSYVAFVLIPRVFQNLDVVLETDTISDVKEPNEKIVSSPEVPQKLTEDEYDEVLSKPLEGVNGMQVGPGKIEWSTFWRNLSSQRLSVRLPVIPNASFREITQVTIEEVLTKDVRDVYDSETMFEKEMSTYITLTHQNRSSQPPHLEGSRDVHLLDGTTEDEIESIKGTLALELPINIQVVNFENDELGLEKTVNNVSVSVKDVGKGQILWSYQGDGRYYMDIKAYNKEGEELSQGSHFSTIPYIPGQEHSSDFKEATPFKEAGIQGQIDHVKIFIAEDIVRREYPFTIQK